MHEVLHWIAGARLPVVLANVNRAVSGGWNIWADQTDSLSQRDTGWIQLYSESNQEVLDSVIMAFKLAERVMLPVMIAYDAFFLSHTSEIVDVPEPSDVDDFLPPFDPPAKMDLDDPRMFGGLVSTDMFYEKRYKMHHDNRTVLEEYPKICAEFAERFGRSYGLVEEYRTQDADIVVAAAGTITSVARLAVERLREEGIKAGLLKIRVFRPVPADAWRRALAGARKVVVVDRNISMGSGGIFAAEAAAALYHAEQRPEIHSAVAGLGGRDVTPDDVAGIMKQALQTEGPAEAPIFWGLKE
jgi:pyruvate/2-oxoacid:ferredoxin oxidoreductase alpha subunit